MSAHKRHASALNEESVPHYLQAGSNLPSSTVDAVKLLPRQFHVLPEKHAKLFSQQLEKLSRLEISTKRLADKLATGTVPKSLCAKPPTIFMPDGGDAAAIEAFAAEECNALSKRIAERVLVSRQQALASLRVSATLQAQRTAFLEEVATITSKLSFVNEAVLSRSAEPRLALESVADKLLAEVELRHSERLQQTAARASERADRAAATMEAETAISTKDLIRVEVSRAVSAAVQKLAIKHQQAARTASATSPAKNDNRSRRNRPPRSKNDASASPRSRSSSMNRSRRPPSQDHVRGRSPNNRNNRPPSRRSNSSNNSLPRPRQNVDNGRGAPRRTARWRKSDSSSNGSGRAAGSQ